MQLTTTLPREPAWRLALGFASIARFELGQRFRRRLGHQRFAVINPTDLVPPDSMLCQEATALVRNVSPTFLLHHGVRAFVFGSALGRADGRRYDRELLYLSCVMHDLGLTSAYDTGAAFEVDGARAAHTFLVEQGVDAERAALVHEAIALHARIDEGARGSAEGALTQLGAGADVMGLRVDDFAPGAVERVIEAWPREAFKAHFAPLLADQAHKKPHCNIAGHVGMGLLRRIERAPFAE
jgi:hypothetical protein